MTLPTRLDDRPAKPEGPGSGHHVIARSEATRQSPGFVGRSGKTGDRRAGVRTGHNDGGVFLLPGDRKLLSVFFGNWQKSGFRRRFLPGISPRYRPGKQLAEPKGTEWPRSAPEAFPGAISRCGGGYSSRGSSFGRGENQSFMHTSQAPQMTVLRLPTLLASPITWTFFALGTRGLGL